MLLKEGLIVVYKDELLLNELKKLVETRDDEEDATVGTRDDSIRIVGWDEKVWLENKKAGNIMNKVLFLGDNIKGVDKLIPVLDLQFDDSGVKFGWAGSQAVLYIDPKALTEREDYDAFLKKLSAYPIPDSLKGSNSRSEEDVVKKEKDHGERESRKGPVAKSAKKVLTASAEKIEKVGGQLAEKSEEMFRNKALMKRQMLFYGVIKMYEEKLEQFMNP